jgi:hypothetical protein
MRNDVVLRLFPLEKDPVRAMHKHILTAASLPKFSMPSPFMFLDVRTALEVNQCFTVSVCLKHFGFNVSPPHIL